MKYILLALLLSPIIVKCQSKDTIQKQTPDSILRALSGLENNCLIRRDTVLKALEGRIVSLIYVPKHRCYHWYPKEQIVTTFMKEADTTIIGDNMTIIDDRKKVFLHTGDTLIVHIKPKFLHG